MLYERLRGQVDFYVVDVETANQARSSICQIGIARFSNGGLTGSWQSLINPLVGFSGFNIGIHGITPDMVADAPAWFDIYPEVDKLLSGALVASHTNFDLTALSNACSQCSVPKIDYNKWIDTCSLARSAWPHLPNHKLVTLTAHFGIVYKAHDALEDARAAGEILLLAMRERRVAIEDFAAANNNYITSFPLRRHAHDGTIHHV
jgi:DNA polymerase-3 subunit epsilon